MPHRQLMMRVLPWAVTVALLFVSAWRWLGIYEDSELLVASRRDGVAAKAAAAPLALPAPGPFDDFRPVIERPLFHPSRRPFPDRKALSALEAAAKAQQAAAVTPAVASAPPPPSPPQGFLLRGTIIVGPFQSAVFERPGKEIYVRVRAGEQLEGWTLVKIARSEVQLRRGEQTVTWSLAKDVDNRQRRP
jgi:hypothetical protein